MSALLLSVSGCDRGGSRAHRRRDPRVDTRQPTGPPHRSICASKKAVLSPSTVRIPLPTPTTSRSVKRTSSRAGEQPVEQAAYAGRTAWLGCGKLLGIFRNSRRLKLLNHDFPLS